MNQQIWSGFTTAALIITSLSTASAGHAESSQLRDDSPGANVSLENNVPDQSVVTSPVPISSHPTADAVKVGEYQSQDEPEQAEETIALIHSHNMDGRSAATLYVREIPVLTFLGSATQSSPNPSAAHAANSPADVKVATIEAPTAAAIPIVQSAASTPAEPVGDYQSDPVWRATAIAAQLNQLYRDHLDASAITANWDAERNCYVIKINDQQLVEINPDTILPDTTNDPAADVLQAANRLRRLLGGAPPLRDVAGRPPEPQQISLGPVQLNIRGMASWYGPGFSGGRSANGEVFNQNALTAAHRSLPFGTQVRVTNLQNGQSVVVRITDRGPYSGHRVIDLSTAAARAVGMLQAGVAPVSLDVLGTARAIANRN
jgi:rare lipoprotein A